MHRHQAHHTVAAPGRMRAVGFNEYGGPDVLSLLDIPRLAPGEGQVCIRVHATPVNPADVWFREGGVAQLVGDAEKPLVPGLELAGEVESVGEGTRFAVGDRVLAVTSFIATGRGAQSELVVVDQGDVAHIPEGMSFSDASTIPMNALTALAALDAADVEAGAALAVVGAAGVVGGMLVQLALAREITVVGVAATADHAQLTEWGIDAVVSRHDPVEGVRSAVSGGVDALVDCSTVAGSAMAAVRTGGTFVALRPLAPSATEVARGSGLRTKLVSVRAYQGDPGRLEMLIEHVRAGAIRLRPTAELPLSGVAAAHVSVAAGGLRERQVLIWP